MAEGRTLVVYYSRTGTTRKVGQEVAKALEAELEEITDRTPRAGVLGYLRAGRDSLLRRGADIEPPGHDPSHYDLVVVGTPVWAFSMACGVRTYLIRQKDKLPEVAFFLTTGGSGVKRTFRHMAALCGKEPVATLGLRMDDVLEERHREELRRFVEALRGEGSVSA